MLSILLSSLPSRPIAAELPPPSLLDSLRLSEADEWGPRDSLLAKKSGGPRVLCGGDVPCPCGGTVIDDYSMTEDLVGCPEEGLIVGADSIVIDCAGHRLSGSEGGAGFRVEDRRRIVIRNCRIADFRIGILAHSSEDLTFRENRFDDNRLSAVWVTGGKNVLIAENYFEENGTAGVGYRVGAIATLESTTTSTIADNTAFRNGSAHQYLGGIMLQESSHNKILNNVLEDTGEDNIWIRLGSGHNRIAGNTLNDSGMDGIWIRESDDNVAEDNIITNIDLYGIYVRSGGRNTIRGNTIEHSGRRAHGGIGIGGHEFPSAENLVERNDVRSSPQGLVVHEYAHDNVFSMNHLAGNGIGVLAGYGLPGLPNRVVRTVIEESASFDVAMHGRESTLEIVGSTFDHDLVRLVCRGGVCRIEVRWFVSLRVEDEVGRPVEAAEATLRDVFGNLVFAGTSGPDGSFPVFEATHYVLDRNGKTEHNAHILEVRKECFEPATVDLWIDGDLSRTIVFAQNPALSVAAGTEKTDIALSVSPNPIRARTTLRFSLPSPARVRLEVYDVRGRLAARIADRSYPAGLHSADWIITDFDRRETFSPGTYFIRLVTGDRSITKKISIACE